MCVKTTKENCSEIGMNITNTHTQTLQQWRVETVQFLKMKKQKGSTYKCQNLLYAPFQAAVIVLSLPSSFWAELCVAYQIQLWKKKSAEEFISLH